MNKLYIENKVCLNVIIYLDFLHPKHKFEILLLLDYLTFSTEFNLFTFVGSLHKNSLFTIAIRE